MRKLIIILLLLATSLSSFSQKWKLTRYEAIVGVGFANYFGDIGGSATRNNWMGLKDLDPLGSRPSFTAGFRYKILQNFNVKAVASAIMLGGRDKGSINEVRGFSFNSWGFEHTVQAEYAFIAEDSRQNSFAVYNRRGMLNNFSKKSFYAFAGVGGITLYPHMNGTATRYDYIKNNFLYTAVIPVGLGVKMIYSNKYALSIELGARYAFSDYLDGLSTTISDFNDIYYFTSFNLIYRIKTSRKGLPILFRSY